MRRSFWPFQCEYVHTGMIARRVDIDTRQAGNHNKRRNDYIVDYESDYILKSYVALVSFSPSLSHSALLFLSSAIIFEMRIENVVPFKEREMECDASCVHSERCVRSLEKNSISNQIEKRNVYKPEIKESNDG